MFNNSNEIVQKVWGYCNVLRDDGVSYGDYLEQLTYLLFLKMADERKRELNEDTAVPERLGWNSLKTLEGTELEAHYIEILENLGKLPHLLGVIFRKAQNRIQDPAKLKRLIQMIDQETWLGLNVDVKGEIYEGLLQKNAEDTKSGAGQYFTPRPLIDAIVEVMQLEKGKTLYDPACGTGGFLVAAYEYLSKQQMDRDQKMFISTKALKGKELVDSVARLCVMNLYLRGIGGNESPIEVGDSLALDPKTRYDYVLTNPPFGKKSSVTITNEEGKTIKQTQVYERPDFWVTSSNKQLNFVQHIKTILSINGKAAVVVPDNVLFEGGAGEKVRRKLLQECNLHTILRLPTGIFYSQGVKANVLFFEKKPAREPPWTEKVWVYDFRTNQHFTLKENKLTYEALQDFIDCYRPGKIDERVETERFKVFSYDEISKRDSFNLDIFWLKDEGADNSENLPEPGVIVKEIIEGLEFALEQFKEIEDELADDE